MGEEVGFTVGVGVTVAVGVEITSKVISYTGSEAVVKIIFGLGGGVEAGLIIRPDRWLKNPKGNKSVANMADVKVTDFEYRKI